jgi:hypothetical protein
LKAIEIEIEIGQKLLTLEDVSMMDYKIDLLSRVVQDNGNYLPNSFIDIAILVSRKV